MVLWGFDFPHHYAFNTIPGLSPGPTYLAREPATIDLRVGSVPLGVDGGEVPALLDGDLEAARVEAVEHAELDVAADVDGAVAAALQRVHRRHGLGTGLK